MVNTKIYSAFCGTGKSYLSKELENSIEIECWKYEDISFPKNIIADIKQQIGKKEYIFISTNPIVLKELYKDNIKFILIYPDIKLKREYMKRYIDRGSSNDFIKTLDTNWDMWIEELSKLNYDKIVLNENEFIKV